MLSTGHLFPVSLHDVIVTINRITHLEGGSVACVINFVSVKCLTNIVVYFLADLANLQTFPTSKTTLGTSRYHRLTKMVGNECVTEKETTL